MGFGAASPTPSSVTFGVSSSSTAPGVTHATRFEDLPDAAKKKLRELEYVHCLLATRIMYYGHVCVLVIV